MRKLGTRCQKSVVAVAVAVVGYIGKWIIEKEELLRIEEDTIMTLNMPVCKTDFFLQTNGAKCTGHSLFIALAVTVRNVLA
jgi:hypothetical protein